jgi:hypothetical protein
VGEGSMGRAPGWRQSGRAQRNKILVSWMIAR